MNAMLRAAWVADIPAGLSAVAATNRPMFFVQMRSIREVGCLPVPKYVICLIHGIDKVVAVQDAG